jgi:hypothetical protein
MAEDILISDHFQNSPTEWLVTSQFVLDFGRVVLGQKKTERVFFRSNSKFPFDFEISVDDITGTGFTISPIEFKNLQHNEKQYFEVTYNTSDRTFPFSGSFQFFSVSLPNSSCCILWRFCFVALLFCDASVLIRFCLDMPLFGLTNLSLRFYFVPLLSCYASVLLRFPLVAPVFGCPSHLLRLCYCCPATLFHFYPCVAYFSIDSSYILRSSFVAPLISSSPDLVHFVLFHFCFVAPLFCFTLILFGFCFDALPFCCDFPLLGLFFDVLLFYITHVFFHLCFASLLF